MEGEDKPADPKPEEKVEVRKSKNLRQATHHLKQEALRRYRLRHAKDPLYESPNDVAISSSKHVPHPPQADKPEGARDSVLKDNHSGQSVGDDDGKHGTYEEELENDLNEYQEGLENTSGPVITEGQGEKTDEDDQILVAPRNEEKEVDEFEDCELMASLGAGKDTKAATPNVAVENLCHDMQQEAEKLLKDDRKSLATKDDENRLMSKKLEPFEHSKSDESRKEGQSNEEDDEEKKGTGKKSKLDKTRDAKLEGSQAEHQDKGYSQDSSEATKDGSLDKTSLAKKSDSESHIEEGFVREIKPKNEKTTRKAQGLEGSPVNKQTTEPIRSEMDVRGEDESTMEQDGDNFDSAVQALQSDLFGAGNKPKQDRDLTKRRKTAENIGSNNDQNYEEEKITSEIFVPLGKEDSELTLSSSTPSKSREPTSGSLGGLASKDDARRQSDEDVEGSRETGADLGLVIEEMVIPEKSMIIEGPPPPSKEPSGKTGADNFRTSDVSHVDVSRGEVSYLVSMREDSSSSEIPSSSFRLAKMDRDHVTPQMSPRAEEAVAKEEPAPSQQEGQKEEGKEPAEAKTGDANQNAAEEAKDADKPAEPSASPTKTEEQGKGVAADDKQEEKKDGAEKSESQKEEVSGGEKKEETEKPSEEQKETSGEQKETVETKKEEEKKDEEKKDEEKKDDEKKDEEKKDEEKKDEEKKEEEKSEVPAEKQEVVEGEKKEVEGGKEDKKKEEGGEVKAESQSAEGEKGEGQAVGEKPTSEAPEGAQAGAAGEGEKKEGETDTNENAAEGKDTAEGQDEEEEEEEGEEGTGERAPRKPEKEKKAKPTMPEDFFYNYEEMASQASIKENSGLPLDMLQLRYSFGYDCTKRANLHLLDEKTVIFAAGNLVQLVNLDTKEHTYLRSTSGGGIGAITVHPTHKYFAVAEKGDGPNINIFEYPSLKLYRVLRGGTEKSYSFVDFSPDGELLASQGGDPDYMLTVWNWREEQTVLRSKAFSQDVFRVTFSTELEGQLTTAGTSHIRFWKMADTFTGLKLQGALGKFGKTEISDIEGYVELPDGKVLSGSEWGNMLLWDGGLIKVEISMKGRKPCHQGNIMQILLDEGELMTVGEDGYIRVWDFESIDTADATDDSGIFELDPMNELKVGTDTKLQCICKSIDTESEVTYWFAQDANGGIWKLDLSFSHTSHAPDKMFTFHAGAVTGADNSPVSDLVATTGSDHTVRVFDYVQQRQICEMRYNSSGTCVLWAPRVVDPKGATILTGFGDGVVRVFNLCPLASDATRKHKNEVDLALQQAMKPHNGPVTSMAINKSGDLLATGGEDGTIFFLTVGTTYNPIGFMRMPAAVRKVQWSPESKAIDKEKLLVFCDNGEVVEVESPEGSEFDTAHTFEITGLKMKTFKFRSIKSRLRHEEELEKKRLEEIERKKKEEEERRKRIERGLETESEQGDKDQEENKEPEAEWKPYIPSEPSPIHDGFYTPDGEFWLSMGGFDAGYMYKCKFLTEEERAKYPEDMIGEPIQSVAVENSLDIPITFVKFSPNGRQVMYGMENGSIRIYTLETEYDISTMGDYWTLNMHDNNYGHITSLVMSHDTKSVVTVGTDSNIFLYAYMGQEEIDEKVKQNKAKIPSARKMDGKSVDDIDDPNAYSIEDAKQKAEHDKMMKQAEEKKRDVRRQIAKLRRQFKSLLEKNDGLPNHLRLKKDEFEMDREIKIELEKQKADRIDLVRKEKAWESEKHRLALEKLRKRYKDVVECERIVVKAFNTAHEVSSFRAAKLSDDFYLMKAEYDRKRTMTMLKDDVTRDPTRDLMTGQTRAADGGAAGDKKDDALGAKVSTTLKGSMGERISKALAKVEEKKLKRATRRAQWDDLYGNKPDDDYEDPNDVRAIKEAKDNMGDYKLKTANDYVVPDHLRMNVEKARGRLLILKDLIHEHKYNFNLKLLRLRDKKIRVIEEIQDVVKQLKDVQVNLQSDKRKAVPPVPEMFPEEMPERKLEYTRETLLQFKKELAEKKTAAAQGDGGFGGFGGFGGGDKPAAPAAGTAATAPGVAKTTSSVAAEEPIVEGDVYELSPLEQQLKVAEEIRLLYEQDYLLDKIKELLISFDAELRLLRHDKFKLDIIMKNADLRQVTLFEEFVLLKEFEKRENILADKVTIKENEKLEMQNKIIEVTSKLEIKKKEIEKLLEREKTLNAQFQGSLGDNNKFADYLTKVFKKKIKRAKNKSTEDGSDEDSDEDSDESDWDEDEDDEDEETMGYDLDVCPPGCDQNLYDNTCQLREKRLDIEEGLTEEKKNNEALKKELEGLNKKAKIIDSNLKTAQNDLEAFQLEKQQKLNELDVVVTLKLHQIQYMVNGMLPQDLSQTLVFESNGVVKLQQRIKELEHEKHSQKKHMKDSKRTHVQLIKDRKVFERKTNELEEECNKMMIDKFGQVVDLEKLETITVNRQIEELKERLRMTEIQCSEELQDWDSKISETKEKITSLIRDNTSRLDQLCLLLNDQKDYEKSLDARQKNSGEDYAGQRKSDVREKQRLIQLVQLQAQEIDALKEEIMLLSRKGGHILPPAQPPLPQTPQNHRTISN